MDEQTVKRELQVNKRLEELFQALDELDKQTTYLAERLTKVMMPETPSGIEEMKSVPPVPQCPLAESLSVAIVHTRDIKKFLISLDRRIEV
jgi:hypothetical protein